MDTDIFEVHFYTHPRFDNDTAQQDLQDLRAARFTIRRSQIYKLFDTTVNMDETETEAYAVGNIWSTCHVETLRLV